MYNKSDIQVDGNRVLAKQMTSGTHYNWVCIAAFYFYTGMPYTPSEMARMFANTITR